MKKILGVAIVGALLLFLVLRYAGGRGTEPIAADPAAASATASAVQPVPMVSSAPAVTATATAAAPNAPASAAAPGDSVACARLVDLCSTSDQKVDSSQCITQMADARKMAGAANVDRSEQCMADAKTCAAASGCLSGGVGMGAMGEFLKGLGGALSR